MVRKVRDSDARKLNWPRTTIRQLSCIPSRAGKRTLSRLSLLPTFLPAFLFCSLPVAPSRGVERGTEGISRKGKRHGGLPLPFLRLPHRLETDQYESAVLYSLSPGTSH